MVTGADMSPLAFVAIMMVIYLIMGCFFNAMSMMSITLPVIYPVVIALGIDRIWFAMVVIVTMETGLITPPVGFNCFAFKNVVGEDATLPAIFASSVPFYIAILVTAAIVFFFPQIATFLPSRM